jgi:pyroglutamyl-peptidase
MLPFFIAKKYILLLVLCGVVAALFVFVFSSQADLSVSIVHDNLQIPKTITGLHDPASKGRIRILVTGFEEFGGYSKNPSKELVQYINLVKPDGFSDHLEVRGIVLPVLYNESWNRLHDEIVRYQPDIVLSYGFNPGSNSVSLERTARNYDGGSADNNNVRHEGPIVEGELPYYYSSLPLGDLERNLTLQGIPVRISDNAGSYVCNHLFYQLMDYYHHDKSGSAGFIHVPDWETGGNNKSLSLMFNTTVSVIENNYYPGGTL